MAEKKKAGFFRRTIDKVRKKVAPTFDEQFAKAKKEGKKTYSRPDTFLLPGEITAEMVQKVKDYFKKDNPNFDADKFLDMVADDNIS